MLSRTHGQPATPSTMGKEIAVFAWRLERVAAQIEGGDYLAKFSGATGTWSAHLSAAPDVDWPELSRSFIEGLGLDFNILTTQIESHDWQVELYDRVRHAGGILHNLATDVWTYISLGYFSQIPVAGATGSSTMPHKINPIRFENAEANLEISGGLLATLSQTLVTSRLQRDLTDSTTQRNIGVAFGHSLLALDNLQRGLREISLAEDVLLADLDANWEVLAEAIQTVVRAEIAAGRSQITDPYALLKDLTRGRRVGGAGARRVRARASTSGMPRSSACSRSRLRPTPASRRSSSTSSDERSTLRASGASAGAAAASASSVVRRRRSTGRSIVFVICAGSTASSSSATITSTAMNETPAMIRASTTAAWRSSPVAALWKKPIETSVTTPANSAAPNASPSSCTGFIRSRRVGRSSLTRDPSGRRARG